MIIRGGKRSLALVTALAAVGLLSAGPAVAAEDAPQPADPPPGAPSPPASQPTPPAPADAKLTLKVKGAKGGKVRVGHRVRVLGRMRPWSPGQEVTVTLQRGKRTMKKSVVDVVEGKGGTGRFKARMPKLMRPNRYQATAAYSGSPTAKPASARSRKFKIRYPSLKRGSGGDDVRLLNKLLDRQGYVPSRGKRFTSRTARAVLAFRKVNGMARITRATSGIFRKLADGRGTYKVKHPGAGKHVEASISRQVLVLADGGKARRIYHVSTGASGTPSDRGHFRFNRRQPGYNSLRMYFTTYYNGGEGIHGYHSVPTHPASHGCIRTPISDARYIYDWVRLGMSIYVY